MTFLTRLTAVAIEYVALPSGIQELMANPFVLLHENGHRVSDRQLQTNADTFNSDSFPGGSLRRNETPPAQQEPKPINS